MTWQLTQNGTALSGSAAITETNQGITGNGSMTGTVTGSSFTFSLSVAAGGFSGSAASCTASITGNGSTLSATTITATYSGSNSCGGAVSSGQITLSKQ